MRKTIGILAHVDAGKTTFSEQALYLTSAIRHLGRVDHQDAFLDAHPLERQRGITIFSGLAQLHLDDSLVYWLDTPGHVDFSPEMERALSVMDYAVVIVSCAEGVQSHTETVWQLLSDYNVPVFFFLNKTDRPGADQEAVLSQLRARLSADILDLHGYAPDQPMNDALIEEVAARDEALLDRLYAAGYDGALWQDTLTALIRRRAVFPLMSGSALTGDGVAAFLRALSALTVTDYDQRVDEPLTARVYQIRHDAQGGRVCFLKLLSGQLHVRQDVPLLGKVNEIRLYHGERFRTADVAQAGDLIAVPGGGSARPGDTLGLSEHSEPRTAPMMASDVLWDAKALPAFRLLEYLRILEDEEPALGVTQQGERLSIHVMGRIQLEVVRQLMAERFSVAVSFGPCRVLYRETVAQPVIGIGHYEPLRHYAEVHLRLVPGPRGSGVRFLSRCHVDTLALNWQRLIETHVFEKEHKGVLTGSPLTDVTVELLTGRAHLKHTEGGDFRQAVYRAIRNALMQAESILLEPICAFTLRAPAEQYGTLSGALTRIQAAVEPPVYEGDQVTLTGEADYARFAAFQEDFMARTHGRGALSVQMSRYAPCHNQAEVVAAAAYQPLADDTPDSVFCAHGAGFTVVWDRVKDFAHLSWEE